MGEARGTVSTQQLQNYAGADIMLMDDNNESVVSGSVASGTFEWTVRWDSAGFTGTEWSTFGVPGYSGSYFENLYQTDGDDGIRSFLTTTEAGAVAYTIMMYLNLQGHYDCTH